MIIQLLFLHTPDNYASNIITEHPHNVNLGQVLNNALEYSSNKIYKDTTYNPAPHLNTKITIQGTVKDAKTGEPIIGATVYAEPTKTGTITGNKGSFTLSVPAGKITISVTYLVGYEKEIREFTQKKNLTLNLLLYKSSAQLSEVEIVGGRSADNV